MRCNIYKDQLESAELFGKPVLFTGLPIERESVPDNWFCYDLAASDRNPVKPATLEDHVVWNRVGTVLSPVPLKRETTLARQIKNSFHLHEELLDLAGFCEKNHLDYPQDPRKYVLRPASPEKETKLFYSLMDLEKDAASSTEQCGFSAEGLQHLQNASNLSIPHTYKWYLLRDSNMPDEQMFSGLTQISGCSWTHRSR